jgi:hypothetical protein
MSDDPKSTLTALTSVFKLKDNKVEEPDVYLGAQLSKINVDGVKCWIMSTEKYADASVTNVEESLAKKGLRFPGKVWTPLPPDYRPELETSATLSSNGIQTYHELIGVLRWPVELGRVAKWIYRLKHRLWRRIWQCLKKDICKCCTACLDV